MSGFDPGRRQRRSDVIGGLGTSWGNDPRQRLVGVVLTTDMFTAAYPPPVVIRDFWTCVHAALG